MFATALSILLTLLGALTLRMEAQLVNPGSAALQQFQDHIDAYLKLRKAAAAEVPKLKPTYNARARNSDRNPNNAKRTSDPQAPKMLAVCKDRFVRPRVSGEPEPVRSRTKVGDVLRRMSSAPPTMPIRTSLPTTGSRQRPPSARDQTMRLWGQ
jgi:hypothetical protein